MRESEFVCVHASREWTPPGDAASVFEALRGGLQPWLLETTLPTARLGSRSFVGCDPYLVLQTRGTRAELACARAVRPDLAPGTTRIDADPLTLLEDLLPPAPRAIGAKGMEAPFCGGAVVVLGYELADRIERLSLGARDELGHPELVALFVDRLVSLDARSGAAVIHGLGFGSEEADAARSANRAVAELADRLAGGANRKLPSSAPAAPGGAELRIDAGRHAKAVDAVKQEIEAGNVYQVCLTHRVERACAGDPWDLYRRLRETNPAPFASYLELPDVTVVGCSPERFLRVGPDGEVESRPIKGTRPRSPIPEVDAGHRTALELSEKDRAENLMIVDLVRNDLGRVCELGSVEVPELMRIEAYASVFQMVSTVTGRLRRDRGVADLLRAAFPPGSMTGAPKIAAMRIIDRLEATRRGIYSGALGYLDARGGLDLCVVIRTALIANGRATVQTGGAIVADSDAEAELREALDKARPLLDALRGSGSRVRRPDRRRSTRLRR